MVKPFVRVYQIEGSVDLDASCYPALLGALEANTHRIFVGVGPAGEARAVVLSTVRDLALWQSEEQIKACAEHIAAVGTIWDAHCREKEDWER